MAISLYELSQRVNSSMPLGTIVPYYGTDEPSGWKICDGRSCAGSELAKKLEISNVPDLRGRFIRMIGGNAAGMAVAQNDCIRNITGQITSGDGIMYAAKASGAIAVAGSGSSLQNGRNTYNSGFSFDASRVVPTGPENRPINMAFNYIIKVNTNVILYYVSNIIYKAIAIGKSLLSRTKEEVRRTMAISLNNHEDRIKALENQTSVAGKMVKIWSGDHNWSAGNLNLGNLTKYSLVIIIGGGGTWLDFVPIPTAIGVTYFQFGDPWGRTKHKIDCNSGVVSYTNEYIGEGHGDNNFKSVWGLKQYYCFSNNILLYRLTQILFDSSLLGLFSQKGGARTI